MYAFIALSGRCQNFNVNISDRYNQGKYYYYKFIVFSRAGDFDYFIVETIMIHGGPN